MTKVIELLNDCKIFPQNWSRPGDVDQESIDAIAEKIESELTAEDIAEHNIKAYTDSVEAYAQKPSNKFVAPEITDFIDALDDGSTVLDLGCGQGRDSLYFTCPEMRDSLNRDGMTSPSKQLQTVPLDGSLAFLRMTYRSLREHEALSHVPLMGQANFSERRFRFPYAKCDTYEDQFLDGGLCDGIWACASLFIHSDPETLEDDIVFWSGKMRENGVFGGSYIRAEKTGRRFLASRSAPGEIKVFTHFCDADIEQAFENCGFTKLLSSKGDYSGRGSEQKDFFGNFLYR